MRKSYILYIFLTVFCFNTSHAQSCTELGQNPGTAFPVCGTSTFNQNNVPICVNRQVPNKNCNLAYLTDKNPYWYKFTCYTSGTLGFQITPNNLTDDYDWQLYDVTGKSPEDVYTDASLVVASNWSGETGITGASSAGGSVFVCENAGKPLFSAMPTLVQGHEYILLISHFSDSQSGYSLSFGGSSGGTASITDPNEPHLKAARAICDGTTIAVKLNKKMKCKSLDVTGAEFSITPAIAPIISAKGIDCSNSFDMDSIVLTLASPIPPGNYKISVKTNSSGATLLDNCNRSIPVTDTQSITVYPQIPTLMDSLTKVKCNPSTLELVFKKPMNCSTIEPTGSDFTITGTSAVSIAGASGSCNADGLSYTVNITLSSPIKIGGIYRITLKTGTDGNTIKNECGMETPAGSFIDLTAYDTVASAFTSTVKPGCIADTIQFSYPGSNGVNSWAWQFDNNLKSKQKDTSVIYTVFGQKNVKLIVSNGTCTDSSSQTITLDEKISAAFEGTTLICPTDTAVFKDKSTGKIIKWNWDFGNGNQSIDQYPASQKYPSAARTTEYLVRLIITDKINCTDTASQTIKVFNNCTIAVPSAFTPNGDGLNDYLYPLNAFKASSLIFKVYNRFGQLVFSTTDWTKKWDGTINGKAQDPGTYVWFLEYIHSETGIKYLQRGTTVLVR